MRSVVAYFLAGIVSFMPKGTRGWFAADEELYRPALISGLMQYAGCAAVLLGRFVLFVQANMGAVAGSAVARGQEETLSAAQYDLGFAVSSGYFVSPVTILLFYLMCEGMARFLAAAVTHEILGTAPLYLLARSCKGLHSLNWKLNPNPGSKPRAIRRRASQSSRYSSLELNPPAPPSLVSRNSN